MSEENRPQQSSAESTVAGAAKTGKAIASIAKGAATCLLYTSPSPRDS